jgi:hypothetical protein
MQKQSFTYDEILEAREFAKKAMNEWLRRLGEIAKANEEKSKGN